MNTKIQVGSRVVFRGTWNGEGGPLSDIDDYPDDAAEIGKAGTVENADGGCPEVRMDSGHLITGWAEERYELVSEVALVLGVGSKVRALVDELDLRKGAVYVVTEVESDNFVVVLDDVQDEHGMHACEYELVASPEPQPATTVYLIAGLTTEYATLEAAEEFLSEFGDNGKEYTITQVVRRVRVNRTTELQSI
jgi:hypothetical protein